MLLGGRKISMCKMELLASWEPWFYVKRFNKETHAKVLLSSFKTVVFN